MKAKMIPLFSTLLVGVVLAQFFLMSSVSDVTALPPRPKPTAVPMEVPQKPRGGVIELYVEGTVTADIWTLIQWQDAQGDWHDVTGWQGTLDEGNMKTWWVGAEDLDTGPFRWVVTQDEETLGVSDPFILPARAGERVEVAVVID